MGTNNVSQVVESLAPQQRKELVRFVTSCSRPPLLCVILLLHVIRPTLIQSAHSGFKELHPNFAIRDSGSDQTRFPTASTCVNLLKVGYYISVYID